MEPSIVRFFAFEIPDDKFYEIIPSEKGMTFHIPCSAFKSDISDICRVLFKNETSSHFCIADLLGTHINLGRKFYRFEVVFVW